VTQRASGSHPTQNWGAGNDAMKDGVLCSARPVELDGRRRGGGCGSSLDGFDEPLFAPPAATQAFANRRANCLTV
jgi:hypothetical protein